MCVACLLHVHCMQMHVACVWCVCCISVACALHVASFYFCVLQSGGGRLVVMTRPRDSSHFPFFRRAHSAWVECQRSSEDYAELLRRLCESITAANRLLQQTAVLTDEGMRGRTGGRIGGPTDKLMD